MRKHILRGIAVIAVVVMGFMAVGYLQAADKPKKVNIGIIAISVMEEPWNTALIQSLERVKKEKPEGLDVKWDVVAENVFPPDAERVLNGIAKTGKYDIIWAHSAYADAIEKLAPKYPEILWVFTGAGNKGLGGNAYWMDKFVHESAYLLGIIAGMMTETNIIGAVGAYPYPNINSPVNAYLEGARSVNPATKIKMTYIDSWFDPPKAKEAALAQIASGADFIYAERFGPFEACKEKGKYAFGHFVDQNSLAPEVVVSSTIALWDGCIKFILNEWWNHETKGTLYNAPKENVFFLMADGGADIAPYHSLGDKIPQPVKDAVDKAHQAIKDGKLKITMNEAKVVSQ
ncbi:MAG: BMP family protein [Candidatus Auribacterota bacterium]|nr:BMP family protein [Candidatus Auribacterota bacterium]